MKPLSPVKPNKPQIKSMTDYNEAVHQASMALDRLIVAVNHMQDDRGKILVFPASHLPLCSEFLNYTSEIRGQLSHFIISGAFIEKKE